MTDGRKEAVGRTRHAMQYGIHCNDLSLGEIEDDVTFAIDRLAELNGLPPVDWDYEPSIEPN